MTQKVGRYGEVGANMMFTQMNQEMNEERGSAINVFVCGNDHDSFHAGER